MYWEIHTVMIMMNNAYNYMHIWLVEAVWLFLRKADFSLPQKECIYLTTLLNLNHEQLRMVPPSQSQIKVIINPTN